MSEASARRQSSTGRKRRPTKAELERELEKVKAELEQTKASAAQLEEQIAQERERLLRLRADFENYKKRAARERSDAATVAKADLVARILPVLDNLERAREAAERDGSPAVAEGIRMVSEQFLAALAEEGVEPIPAVGQPFDPMLHEAVGREKTDEVAEGYVVREEERGFRLGERVIRPAKVITAEHPDDNKPDQ